MNNTKEMIDKKLEMHEINTILKDLKNPDIVTLEKMMLRGIRYNSSFDENKKNLENLPEALKPYLKDKLSVPIKIEPRYYEPLYGGSYGGTTEFHLLDPEKKIGFSVQCDYDFPNSEYPSSTKQYQDCSFSNVKLITDSKFWDEMVEKSKKIFIVPNQNESPEGKYMEELLKNKGYTVINNRTFLNEVDKVLSLYQETEVIAIKCDVNSDSLNGRSVTKVSNLEELTSIINLELSTKEKIFSTLSETTYLPSIIEKGEELGLSREEILECIDEFYRVSSESNKFSQILDAFPEEKQELIIVKCSDSFKDEKDMNLLQLKLQEKADNVIIISENANYFIGNKEMVDSIYRDFGVLGKIENENTWSSKQISYEDIQDKIINMLADKVVSGELESVKISEIDTENILNNEDSLEK